MSYRCDFCNESFEDQDALYKHLRAKHKDKIRMTKREHPQKGVTPEAT